MPSVERSEPFSEPPPSPLSKADEFITNHVFFSLNFKDLQSVRFLNQTWKKKIETYWIRLTQDIKRNYPPDILQLLGGEKKIASLPFFNDELIKTPEKCSHALYRAVNAQGDHSIALVATTLSTTSRVFYSIVLEQQDKNPLNWVTRQSEQHLQYPCLIHDEKGKRWLNRLMSGGKCGFFTPHHGVYIELLLQENIELINPCLHLRNDEDESSLKQAQSDLQNDSVPPSLTTG